MVVVSAADVKVLREQTGAGIMECKKALEEAEADIAGAVEILRKRGIALAASKAHRATTQGVVECYTHAGGRIGAMVEVNCETDFVARTDIFKELAHDLAMQVAAMGPISVSEEDLSSGAEGEPAELCLLLQAFIKDPSRTIKQVIAEAVGKTGENIQVRRFARFELGRQE